MTVKKKVIGKPADAGGELDAAGVAAIVLATLNALGVNTNAGAGAGASAGLGATDTQNKTDVNVPEVLTGMNAMTQKRALAQEGNIDLFANQIVQNGITHSNMIATNNINNSDLIAKAAIKHADLAADRIWNPDEVAYAVAAITGRMFATMNNPVPVEE